jgi:autophagy-related protein 9
MAYPYADRYLQQFPKHKMEQLYNFIGFVSGSFFAVLAIAAALDPELFLGFQITDGKTVLFYMGVFSGIWSFARNNVSTQDEPVMDPKLALSCVIEFTHYCPVSWKNRLHTDEVRQEFTSLYQVKIVSFLEEILSMVLTPYILITRLPKCSERIVDFFREFTVHVDGLGSVCSYAVFDFKKGAENAAQPKLEHQDSSGLRDDYYATKDAKLAASLMGFMENYVTNPTRNRRYTRNPKNTPFYPPPTFSLYNFGGESLARGGSRPPPAARVATHTPRMNPAPGRTSPMHSILLDPHHQPSVMRNSSRQNPQGRFRGSRAALNEPNELDEAPETEIPMQRMAASKITEEDGSLGESWRTTKVVQSNQEDDDENDQAPGVLGLLYQFQKRQTEGRGGLGM